MITGKLLHRKGLLKVKRCRLKRNEVKIIKFIIEPDPFGDLISVVNHLAMQRHEQLTGEDFKPSPVGTVISFHDRDTGPKRMWRNKQ